jgi:hypothetical protein
MGSIIDLTYSGFGCKFKDIIETEQLRNCYEYAIVNRILRLTLGNKVNE